MDPLPVANALHQSEYCIRSLLRDHCRGDRSIGRQTGWTGCRGPADPTVARRRGSRSLASAADPQSPDRRGHGERGEIAL